MPTIHRIARILHLGRLSMAPLTVSVPILGALTLSEKLELGDILSLAAIGLCAHLFGFALNDIIDSPIDRTTPHHKKHPLVTGQALLWEAWVFSLVQAPIAFGIYHIFLDGNSVASLWMLLSIALSVPYNLWSKRGPIPHLLPELSLAISVGALSLFGSATQADGFTPKSIVFALALTLILLLLNSIPNGLKDLKTDQEFGARSFAISAGCRVIDGDRVSIPARIWGYSGILQGLIIVCLVVLAKLFALSLSTMVLVGVLLVCSTMHLRMVLASSSFLALHKSFPILNGFYNYLALCVIVMTWMPFYVQVVYGILIARVLAIPLQLSYRMWRNRYYPLVLDRE